MADQTKFLSQITPSPNNVGSTDQIVGVRGTTDLLFTPAQLGLGGGGGSGSTVVVTTNTPVVVGAGVQSLIFNLPSAHAMSVTLPAVSTRSGLALGISDFAGNAGSITVTPAFGESIGGLAVNAPWTVVSGGALTLLPVVGVGWAVMS